MTMTDDDLLERLRAMRDQAAARGEQMFKGIPDHWFEHPLFRCGNDHVSRTVLRSEQRGDLCLAGYCGRRVWMTFPGDSDGPLAVVLAPLPVTLVCPVCGRERNLPADWKAVLGTDHLVCSVHGVSMEQQP